MDITKVSDTEISMVAEPVTVSLSAIKGKLASLQIRQASIQRTLSAVNAEIAKTESIIRDAVSLGVVEKVVAKPKEL